MKPAAFNYHAPTSLNEVFSLLESSNNARVMAGGQSLMPMLNYRLLEVDDLIDINGIQDLCGIKFVNGSVEMGAMTRQFEIAESSIVQSHLPLMAEAIKYVGHVQTRNRGTLGGSLCQMDPSAEMSLVASAYKAELVVASKSGERVVSIDDFCEGYMTPAIRPNEVLKLIRFHPWSKDSKFSFFEFARRHGDFAIVSAACLMELEHETIKNISLVLGGISSHPVRLSQVEAALRGKKLTELDFEQLISSHQFSEMLSDKLYPSWYREHLSRVLISRVFKSALNRSTH